MANRVPRYDDSLIPNLPAIATAMAAASRLHQGAFYALFAHRRLIGPDGYLYTQPLAATPVAEPWRGRHFPEREYSAREAL